VLPHIVDKILNHSGGTIRSVAAIYNWHQYSQESKAALELWGRLHRDAGQAHGRDDCRQVRGAAD
jgi:hypothetical protein